MFELSEHLWWVKGLILNMILPLLPSCWGFSFANILQLVVVQQQVVFLEFSQEKMSTQPSPTP